MKDSSGDDPPRRRATSSPTATIRRRATPSKEARRPHMESLFDDPRGGRRAARNDLYLAWDFTVASARNITERLLFIRDDAFARLGTDAPAFTVTQRRGRTPDAVEHEHLPPRRPARSTVERYVNSDHSAGALPARRRTACPSTRRPPQPANFICTIPRAALPTAAGPPCRPRVDLRPRAPRLAHRGRAPATSRTWRNEHNFVFCATKLDRHVGRRRRDRHQHPAATSRTSRTSPTASSRGC